LPVRSLLDMCCRLVGVVRPHAPRATARASAQFDREYEALLARMALELPAAAPRREAEAADLRSRPSPS